MGLKTVYLCGGINGLSDSAAKDWREAVKVAVAGKLSWLDPMRRDYRGKEDESVNLLVEGDKEDIVNSDIILVNATKPSWGTAMEIVYAHFAGKKKRIVAFVEPGAPVSPWLRYHCQTIVASLDDAVAAILA